MATKRKVFTLVDEEPDEEPAAKKARGRQGGRNRRRPPLRQTSWVCRPQKTMTYAVDTSICERGFALMNNLKTARRSRMGNLLLRTLMTICELGDDWKDAAKIPVDEIPLSRSGARRARRVGMSPPCGGGGAGGAECQRVRRRLEQHSS